MRILFVLATPEYFRYYDSTIHLLAERGHQVDIAINRARDGKPGLSGLRWEHPRVTFAGEAPTRGDRWESIAGLLRGVTDFSRYLDSRYSSASALRARMKRKSLPVSFSWLDWIPSLPRPVMRVWVGMLAAAEQAIPAAASLDEFIERHCPDLVVVSPLVDFGAAQVDTVKSAHKRGVPVAACIASWDNLTNKGLMRVLPDRVLVWNEAQRRETSELHRVPADRVIVTGAQLFDRWFEERATTSRHVFCEALGLDAAKPIVLYTCSSSFIAPAPVEISFVRDWVTAIRANPATASANVLIRPHPFNVWEWHRADFSDLGAVAVHPRDAYDPLVEEVLASFYDAIYHSAAVVGVNTSAMIEAAIIGRPVFSVLAPQFAAKQEGTLHFHHLLPEYGGFVRLSRSIDEHVPQLASAIVTSGESTQRTSAFVRSFIRPLGLDRPCTPIVADALEHAAKVAPTPVSSSLAVAPLRAALVIVGALVWPIEELAAEKPFGALRKKIRTAVHRWRKEWKSSTAGRWL